jgi:hypothetical protein
MEPPSINFLESIGLIALGVLSFFIFARARGRLAAIPFALLGLGIWYLIANVIYGIASIPSIVSPPTSLPTTAIPTRYPTQHPLPPPTRASSNDCILWSSVTTSHVGSTLCVFGFIVRIEDTYAWIVRFRPERSHFYFVSASVWYPDIRVGDCVAARGKIELSAEQVPYLNITQNLYSCEPWMFN